MIEDLVKKQRELMARVPHAVRPDSLVKMTAGIKVIDNLLRYLNSTGHKPWRPTPLSPIVQEGLLAGLKQKIGALSYIHHTCSGADKDFSRLESRARQMVSVYGVIEEAIEYMNSLLDCDDRAHRLEEHTDILFFYMELMILDGFTWEEVEKEYRRKWEINMERYRKAERGDYSWDKRGEGVL